MAGSIPSPEEPRCIELDLKIDLDLEGPYGWKIPDRRYPCYLRNLLKSPLDIAHILSNKGKPDIVVIVSQIVVGNTGVAVHYLNKIVDLFLGHLGGAERARKIELTGMKIAPDSSDNPLISQPFYGLDHLIF